jgi:ABC-type phosphate/phosphonate transport system substrate-binding protein
MLSQLSSSARGSLITSHRLYNATPRAANAWAALFARVFSEIGIHVRTVAHSWPQPLETLWEQPGLCAAFMCGWPYAKTLAAGGTMQAIVAPVPAFPSYAGVARYRSEFLVRAANGWTRLDETFGSRYGWMETNSQSSWNGPRSWLAQYVNPERPALFSESRGPYGNPIRAIDALCRGEIDVTAIDSFYLDLIRANAPDRLAGLRTVDMTAWAPPPLLVAAGNVEPAIVCRLRGFLTQLHHQEEYRPMLVDASVERFDLVDPASYLSLLDMERASLQRGYPVIR